MNEMDEVGTHPGEESDVEDLAAAVHRPPTISPPIRLVEDEAMRTALEEAALAVPHGDVPVGAVVLDGSSRPAIIGRRHNEREAASDPTAHAEMLVLRDAAAALGSWRLEGCTLVVTLEPCAMCAGALVAARARRLVFGAYDPKAGACGSLYNIVGDARLNHELEVIGGLHAADAGALLEQFFRDRRS